MSNAPTDSDVLGETQLATPTDEHAAAPARVPTVIGRFRVTGTLGQGGMGVVYAAVDEVLDRKVAVKLLHAHTGDAEARSLAEARALARLAHPNVVTIHEVGTHDGAVYVAMELIEGTSLRTWLEADRPWRERLDVVVQAGRGLSAAHAAGLVHRDFKPDNVMVGDDGRVRVLDFGLAIDERVAGGADTSDDETVSGRLTRAGALVGTPLYMAPEQWVADPTDARTDQFALCLVLYEAMYRQRAFAGATIGALRTAVINGRVGEPASGAVPDGVLAVIRRGLQVEPEHRHPSIDALLDALGAATRPRRRRAIAIGATLALVAAVGVAVAAWPAPPPPPPVGEYDAILAASDLPAVQPAPLPDDPMQVTVDRLSNGLTVYISPDRSKPAIHAAVVVRAGTLRDPLETTGLSHMVGHLLGKGTRRVGTADFAAEEPHLQRIRGLYEELAAAPERRAELLAAIDAENVAAGRHVIAGESASAMTALGATGINIRSDADWTLSAARLPSNRFDAWAELEADRWMNTVFRQYYAEVGAVLEELRLRSGWSRFGDALLPAAFPGHPYGVNPIGTPADVQAQPYLALEAYYQTWFVPNNAAVILVGDVDRERALPILERAFGSWRPRALPSDAPPIPAPLTAPATIRIASTGERAALMMWQLPAAGHPDEAALEVVRRLLDEGSGGLLAARVASGELSEFGVEVSFQRVAGRFLIAALPGGAGDPGTTIAVVDDVLAQLARGDVSQARIDEVVRDAELEPPGDVRPDRRRDAMVDAFATGRPWPQVAAGAQRLAAVRPADVARVVTRYLGAIRATALIEPGEAVPIAIDRPTISPVEFSDQARSPWVAALLATEVVPIEPRFLWPGRDYTRIDTAAGPVIAVANPRDQRFWLRLDFELGDHQVPGLCAALESEQTSGDEVAAARRQAWTQLGLEVRVECASTSAALELVGRDDRLDDAWRAIDDWLTGPALAPAIVETRLARHREDLAQLSASADWRSRALIVYATAGPGHPALTRIRDGARSTLTGDDLAAALRTLRGAARATMYFGSRPAAQVATLVASIEPLATTPPRFVVRTLRPTRPRIVVLDDRGRDNTDVHGMFPMARLTGDRTLEAELLQAYLQGAGVTSPIGTVLRAQRGLVYSADVSVYLGERPDEPAELRLSIVAAPENAVTALELALPLLRDATPDPIRVAEARATLEALYRANWATDRQIAYNVLRWTRAGHDGDPRFERFGRIHELGEDDLAPMFDELAAAPMIVAIAGDARKLDLPRLRALGDVTVLTPAELTAP